MLPITAHSEQLERFRSYLTMLARTQMDELLKKKYEASDLVQLTMLQAHQAIDQFRGETAAEMAGWLRRILARNLAHAHRDLRREKRDIARERSLEGALERSAARIEGWLVAQDTSPSQKAIRTERLLRISRAIESLPDDQRDAVVLHYWKGLTMAEAAEAMGRTRASVGGLIHRALKVLKVELEQEGPDHV